MSGARASVASRVIFDDMGVGDISAELIDITRKLRVAADNLAIVRNQYVALKARHEHRQGVVADDITQKYTAESEKFVRAELERKLLDGLRHDDELSKLSLNLDNAKANLDDAQLEFDVTKYDHRAITSRAGLVTESLGFMTASKVARTVATEALRGL